MHTILTATTFFVLFCFFVVVVVKQRKKKEKGNFNKNSFLNYLGRKKTTQLRTLAGTPMQKMMGLM